MAINSLGHITSADSEVVLTCEELYPNGVNLEGYSADQILTGEDITIAETRIGVDGRLSAGYTPSAKNVTISLEASSPSQEVMRNIFAYMETNKTQPEVALTITIPSQNAVVQYTQGCMTKGRPIPDIKKLLDPTNWTFTFAKVKITTTGTTGGN